MNNDRPIVFTITRNDAVHYNISTKDSRADLQANVGCEALFPMLLGISETFNEQGYAVLFKVD